MIIITSPSLEGCSITVYLEEEAAALGVDAIIGLDLDYETIGQSGRVLMVGASDTAGESRRDGDTLSVGFSPGRQSCKAA